MRHFGFSCGLTFDEFMASIRLIAKYAKKRTHFEQDIESTVPSPTSKNYLACSSAHGAPARGEGKRSPRARINSVSSFDNVAGGSMRTTA